MSCANPTRRPLRTPERHRGFLLEAFRLGRAAFTEELAKPAPLPDRPSLQRKVDAHERLLKAIEAGEIATPDPDAQRVVAAVLDATDADNDYGRVVAEHAALVGLLDQLGLWGGEGR